MICISFLKKHSSLIVIIAITFILFNLQKNLKPWNDKNSVIQSDIVSYYAYLPATFLYHDITLSFIDNRLDKGSPKYIFWPEKTKTGKYCIKTTMGMAILYSPFFFIGHLIATQNSTELTGFSWPYEMSLVFVSIIYLFLGLFFLRKILLRLGHNNVTIIAITLGLTFGTNILMYTVRESLMTHISNFMLINIFIFLTIKWHETNKISTTIILGLIAGLMSLIRPTNIIITLLFVFWNISNITDLKQRILQLWKKSFHIVIIVFLIFIIWLPQLLYWKEVSGSYLFNSYGKESFFFNNPHFLKGLFGFRNGLFIYCPILLLSIVGFITQWKENKNVFLPLIVLYVLNVYIILSWWAWTYGGAEGPRAFIDTYGILAIPMATLIHFSFKKFYSNLPFYNKIKSISYKSYLILLFFILFFIIGIKHNLQWINHSLHYSCMTFEAYMDNFPKQNRSSRFYWLLRDRDNEKALRNLTEDVIIIKDPDDSIIQSKCPKYYIYCSFENISDLNDTKYIKTNNDFLFRGEYLLKNNYSFSGTHSLKLNYWNDSIELFNIPKNLRFDTLTVTIWRKGNLNGQIVLSKDNRTIINSKFIACTKNFDWEKIRLIQTFKKDEIKEGIHIALSLSKLKLLPAYFDEMYIEFR